MVKLPQNILALVAAAWAVLATFLLLVVYVNTPSINSKVPNYINSGIPVFLDDPRPDVQLTAVILTNNNSKAFELCLDSLLAQKVRGFTYEVIVADNGCSPGTASAIQKRSIEGRFRVKHLPICRNIGYSFANNEATELAATSSRWIQFLNDDLILNDNFLQAMFDLAVGKPNVGGVCCKLISMETGKILEAGSVVWQDGSSAGYGRGESPTNPLYNFVRPVDYGSGACLLVSRSAFVAAGGFNGTAYKAYYEDTDLQMHINHVLHKFIFYQPQAEAHHQEHASFGKANADMMMQRGQKMFVQRWAKALKDHLPQSFDDLDKLQASDSRRHSVPVVVFDQLLPRRNYGSGFARAFDNILILSGLGYRVTAVGLNEGPDTKAISLRDRHTLQQNGVEIYEPAAKAALRRTCLPGLALLKERKSYYRVCIVSRPHNQMLDCMEDLRAHCPSILYDAESIFYRRDEQFLRFSAARREILSGEMYRKAMYVSTTLIPQREKELSQLNDVDSIVFASASDRDFVRRALPDLRIPVTVVGHVMSPSSATALGKGFHDRRGMLFIGAFDGEMYYNGDAILWFLTDVYPVLAHLRSQVPLKGAGGSIPQSQVPLTVAGRSIPQDLRDFVQRSAFHESIELVESPSADALLDLYNNSLLGIVPHQYAAGVQYKLSEAMANGLPCVVSQLAADGFGLQSSTAQTAGLCVGETPASFAQCIVDVYENAAKWKEMRELALLHIKKTHMQADVAASLALAVNASISSGASRQKNVTQPKGCHNGESLYLHMYPKIAKQVQAGSNSSGWHQLVHPDIAKQVQAGFVSSGWHHFVQKGVQEKYTWRCDLPLPKGKTGCSIGEKAYQQLYPDIADAIQQGTIDSGWYHFSKWGWKEGRVWGCKQTFLDLLDEAVPGG